METSVTCLEETGTVESQDYTQCLFPRPSHFSKFDISIKSMQEIKKPKHTQLHELVIHNKIMVRVYSSLARAKAQCSIS